MKKMPDISRCPGTLAEAYKSYSPACLKRLFNGRKVFHVLPYNSPASDRLHTELFEENQRRISISGVQEKFSLLLEKNKLRLTGAGEQGTYILKPIPGTGKNADQMAANEHLTMQIARQVYNMATAENALIFFNDGSPAYLCKRFDVLPDGGKLAKEDFASLAGKTPQTHGTHYKYTGSYLALFSLLKKYVPAYKVEALTLFRLILFNYLFSNGDAHLKNFSLLETPMGDFKLSPAYDLLNSHIHIDDDFFALEDGLLPGNLRIGNIRKQLDILASQAGIDKALQIDILEHFCSKTEQVEALVKASFLKERIKRNYFQAYEGRLKRLFS